MSKLNQWLIIIGSIVIGVILWGCNKPSKIDQPLPPDAVVELTHPVASCPGCVGPSVDKQPQAVVPAEAQPAEWKFDPNKPETWHKP